MKKRLLFALAVLCFWAAGAAGQIFFRISSDTQEHYWCFFILGNLTCVVTAGAAMAAFGLMKNANIVSLLLYGCSFIVGQVAMWLCFRSPLTLLQLIGIAIIIIGTVMGTLGEEQKS